VDVTLTRHFSIGQFAVTQGQWREVMSSEPWQGQDFVKLGDDVPATYINWEEARAFCKELTTRDRKQGSLPRDWIYDLSTEAQWEFACRGGTNSRFSFGEEEDELDGHAWYIDNAWDAGEGHPLPAGQKLPNAFGLFDMHGNVWEWGRDWYHPKLPGGTDPEATAETDLRVTRGGSWGHASGMCRSAYRLGKEPETKSSTQGFRVAAVPVA
jgi:formylglycine-generating enzyme required for sulfatase activity